MATDLNASFNEQYMNISSKLKKRFMRKPNVSEATNEFNALAIQCEHSEQPAFAGHTYIGAAKCEGSVGNFLGEAEYYVAAARQFMKAELKLSSLMCYSPARENLEAAIGCYLQALTKYPNDSPLKTAVLMEMANNLVLLKQSLEAISYYEQALETLPNDSKVKIQCLCKLLELHHANDRYDTALDIANEIRDMEKVPKPILTEVRITSVLLALIVEPPADKRTKSLQQLFSEITDRSDEYTGMCCFDAELRVKLQSIIMCCDKRDVESLVEITADIGQFFNTQHQDLLMKLIRSLQRKA